MKNRLRTLLLLGIFLFTMLTPLAATNNTYQAAANNDYLQEIMNMVQKNYNFEVSNNELVEGAVKGIFSSMDDYTEFFTSEEAASFMEAVDGNYEGVGIVLSKMDNYIVITRVMPTSPAEKAGLLAGDKIAIVDKTEVVGASMDKVTSLIRGERDSQVTLGVIRNNKLLSITVSRARISLSPVNYEIRDGIGYISIDSFNSNAYENIRPALAVMDAKKIDRIILDLRNNTGGEVKQAVDIAREFIPEGLITTLNFKSPDMEDETYLSSLKNPKYKLVVLVNGMTASASEILAGAVQDRKAGVLVGTKTYGKARVQNVIPLLTPQAAEKYSKQLGRKVVDAYDLPGEPTDDEILGLAKLTVGTYSTPAGGMIDTVGLTPDYVVADHDLVNGIYINNVVRLTSTSKPDLNSESIDVYNAEKILRLDGYDVDMPDMKLDVKTFAAIEKFQTDNGLFPYGVLDFTTQAALNKELDSLILKIDKQYAKAFELIKE